jgi:hypothetical protein
LRWGLVNFLPSFLFFGSQVARITGMSHHAQPA